MKQEKKKVGELNASRQKENLLMKKRSRYSAWPRAFIANPPYKIPKKAKSKYYYNGGKLGKITEKKVKRGAKNHKKQFSHWAKISYNAKISHPSALLLFLLFFCSFFYSFFYSFFPSDF